MTRVLMTADTVGGVWTYALELADALAPRDVEVHLATMGRRMSPAQRAEVADSSVAGVHESEFALEWMPRPWADVDAAGEWLADLAADLRPDVVHLNGYAHAARPWAAPTVVVAHSDVLSWWRAVHGAPAPPDWGEYHARVSAGLHAADAVVAPTAHVLEQLRRSYPLTGGTVIANCRRDDWRTAVRERPKEPLVLGAGRLWDAAKNIAVLDAAAAETAWPVVLAGDDTGPDGVPHGARHATVLGNLPFDQLATWLVRASVFAAPARYEPFGLAALEAAQAGCALVLGDIPSLREVWGDAAVYVPPDDVDALATTLNALADDPGRRHALASAASERAHRYSPARTAASYVDLYRRLPARTGGLR